MQLKSVIALLLACGVIVVISRARVGAEPMLGPAGADHCADATPITPGTYSGTTAGADNDGTAGCGQSATSPDVWYSYVATGDELVTVSTCGFEGYDTVLSLHNGCPGMFGQELTCNDDTCGLQSTVSAILTTGEKLIIRVSGYDGASGPFDLELTVGDPPTGGPDVVYSDCTSIADWGAVGGTHAYSLGSNTCNIGAQNLLWGNSHNGTPVLGMNGYRLHQGRLTQIGMSWAKHGTGAAAGGGCGLPCNGQGGSVLGAGCRDIYSSGFNGSFGILGPRSDVNAWTGALLSAPSGSGDAIYRRLQISESDLSDAGALYFVEGVYVALDDAGIFGNAYNNASYKRVTVDAGFAMAPVGNMELSVPAVNAWRDHGLGVGVPDPSVSIQDVDVPGEGRFVAGTRVIDNGDGTWRYEYAVFNLNSDRSAGSLTVPLPAGVTVSAQGFHDVDYHSGEIYDNTDWTPTVDAGGITWSSPQTHAQNPNSNALRWGTMYNFWFTADASPTTGSVDIGLFKPGSPTSVAFQTSVPGGVLCPTDLSGDGMVDVTDLLALLGAWGTPAGDVTGDGLTDIADLLDLLAAWGSC